MNRTPGLARLPFFVGAGAADFGRRGAKGLHDALLRAGVTGAVYREYPDVEHLVIVQAALRDVFRFFDTAAQKVGR